MRRTTEIQVGLTVVAAVAVLLWGVTWLREFKLGTKVRVWQVSFPQTGGLGPSDEVQVNGIRKGSVSTISLAGDHVVVSLALEKDITLTRDCRVMIRNVGLMGEKVISVEIRPTGGSWTERDTIPGVYEPGMTEFLANAAPSFDAMNRVILSLDRLAGRLDREGELDKTLANVRATSAEMLQTMKENRALLHETMLNTRDASKSIRDLTAGREGQFGKTLDALERGTRNFERLTVKMDSATAVVRQVGDKLNQGTGSAGMLINDRKLYDETRATLQSMRELLEDMKKNPKKYINLRVF